MGAAHVALPEEEGLSHLRGRREALACELQRVPAVRRPAGSAAVSVKVTDDGDMPARSFQ